MQESVYSPSEGINQLSKDNNILKEAVLDLQAWETIFFLGIPKQVKKHQKTMVMDVLIAPKTSNKDH